MVNLIKDDDTEVFPTTKWLMQKPPLLYTQTHTYTYFWYCRDHVFFCWLVGTLPCFQSQSVQPDQEHFVNTEKSLQIHNWKNFCTRFSFLHSWGHFHFSALVGSTCCIGTGTNRRKSDVTNKWYQKWSDCIGWMDALTKLDTVWQSLPSFPQWPTVVLRLKTQERKQE